MDDYEHVHVHPGTGAIAVGFLDKEQPHAASVAMERRVFEADLRAAFATAASATRQANLDMPRSVVLVDGVRLQRADAVAPRLHAFCTQAVVGLAVQLLCDEARVVAECAAKTPLRVAIHTGDATVVASKRLRVLDDAERSTPVTLLVHLDGDAAWIRYVFA